MNKPKIRQSPKLPAETRREQLLASACRLFAEKGYEVTSTEEIARKAGLTKGALYFHFKSKEDILLALIESVEDRFREHFARLELGRTTPGRYFRAIFEVKASGGLPDPNILADVGMQAMKIPRVRRYMRESHRRYVREFVDAIDPSLGYSRKKLEQMGILILSLFHGLCGLHWMDPKFVHIGEQVDIVEALFDPEGLQRGDLRRRATRIPANGSRSRKALRQC
jgi:AcrR family transcriptional regulator